MAPVTESEVLAALASYRAHVATINRRAMEMVIPQIEAADIEDPDMWDYPEQKEEMRLNFMGYFLGDTEPPITRPSDVLDKWDLLVQQLALDGGMVNHNTEYRDKMRQAYRSGILEGLRRLECPTGEWELPSDFDVVMQHIDSLEGAGWYRSRELGGLLFWEGWGAHGSWLSSSAEIQRKVMTGQDIIENTGSGLEDYHVAAGWELGTGNESYSYAIYSQPKEGGGKCWSWRYFASLGQFGNEVFENMVEVLNWCKNRNEPNMYDLDVGAEEVFQP